MAAYYGRVPQEKKSSEEWDVAAYYCVGRSCVVGYIYRLAGMVRRLCDSSCRAGDAVIHGDRVCGVQDGGCRVSVLSGTGGGFWADPDRPARGRRGISPVSIR